MHLIIDRIFVEVNCIKPIAVAEWPEAKVCVWSFAGIASSNPTGNIDVCLLWMLCAVGYKSLRLSIPCPESPTDCGVSECD
jgi:hypothetical protein